MCEKWGSSDKLGFVYLMVALMVVASYRCNLFQMSGHYWNGFVQRVAKIDFHPLELFANISHCGNADGNSANA